MDSLWPKFEEQDIEVNDSIQILREQARAIKSETNGIVSATFSKMNYKTGPTHAMKSLSLIATAIASATYEEVLDEELSGKKDVNDLYSITKYKFEIFNSEYRFRLFIVYYREMFPISLDVDEGILQDIQYKNAAPLSSNKELKTALSDIFSSFKVRSVVAKMLQQGKHAE